MKNIKLFLAMLIVVGGITTSLSQAIDSSYTFKNFDSVIYQLNKFGLGVSGIPGAKNCPAYGTTPPVTIRKPVEPQPYMPPEETSGSGVYHASPTDINVFWIHGLNGTVESLKIPAKASQYGSLDRSFPARRITSVVGPNYLGTPQQPAYAEGYGITRASEDWRTTSASLPVNNGFNPPHTQKDFIIAHSQGGIVAREWLRNMDETPVTFPDHAHGLVTFGTPHAGAAILNNTRPDLLNKAPAFFNEGCRALANATVTEIVQRNFITRLLVSSSMQNTIVNSGCNVFSNTIVPFALDNYHKRTTLDYYVGSAFLTQASTVHPQGGLSDYTLKVPVVQFYGEEEQPVMWRFFSSTLSLETDAMDNAQIEFGYDKDDALQIKVVNMINEFQAKYYIAQNHYNYWNNKKCYIWLFCPTCYGICKWEANDGKNKNSKLMNAYGPAITWLSEANDYYLADLVGAKVTNTEKYCLEEKVNYCERPRPGHTAGQGYNIGGTIKIIKSIVTKEYLSTNNTCPASRTVSTGSGCYERTKVTPVYRTTSYYKPNDGVVLAESAAANIKNVGTHRYWKMKKTNHDQMKNSFETKTALTKLYNGELGDFFTTPLR